MPHEFYQVIVGAPTMTLYSWKQLAHWSIEYSYLSEYQKKRAKEILVGDWNKFCTWVVNEYGPLMDGDVINEERAREAYPKAEIPSSDQNLSS